MARKIPLPLRCPSFTLLCVQYPDIEFLYKSAYMDQCDYVFRIPEVGKMGYDQEGIIFKIMVYEKSLFIKHKYGIEIIECNKRVCLEQLGDQDTNINEAIQTAHEEIRTYLLNEQE